MLVWGVSPSEPARHRARLSLKHSIEMGAMCEKCGGVAASQRLADLLCGGPFPWERISIHFPLPLGEQVGWVERSL